MPAHGPGTRPANHVRSFTHALSGVVCLLLVQHLLTPLTMIVVAALAFAGAWTMEISRRRSERVNALLMRLFGPIAHAYEAKKVNSATWFVTALFLLTLTTSPLVCSLAVMVLGFGDPAASYVGRRFGRHRITTGRSVEGSLGFVVVAWVVAFLTLAVYYPHLPLAERIALAASAAVFGAVGELVTLTFDDNLVVPLAAAAGAAVVAAAMG